MRKRIKYRLKNDSAAPFWTSIVICLIGAAVSSLLFYRSFYRSLSKLNEKPIATITFKYKAVQRRFIDRMIWDRLQQNSPLYNGDTVATADLSEAVVMFDDGTALELSENTMAQVFIRSDGSLAADLDSGAMNVNSSEESSVTLSAGGVSVDLKAGAQLHARTGEAQGADGAYDVAFNVLAGNAELDGRTVQAGRSLIVDETGSVSSSLAVTEPNPQAKIIYHTNGAYPVRFAWQDSGDVALVLTIAEDRNFKRIVRSVKAGGARELSVNLNKGVYYWRLAPAEAVEGFIPSTGRLQLVQSFPPSIVAPEAGARFRYHTRPPAVRFIWSEAEAAAGYDLVVADNPKMENPIIEQRISGTSSVISTLNQGTYWWRVTPYYAANRLMAANPSKEGRFTVEQLSELSAPTLSVPLEGAFVDRLSMSVTFSWRAENEATGYRLVIANNPTLNEPEVNINTDDNFYVLHTKRTPLAAGRYYWAVAQETDNGGESEQSTVRSFYAVDGQIEQRTIFPPDGYAVQESVLSDMRFTYKTSLPAKFQIAKDEDFGKITYESTSDMSHGGVNLAPGVYWWRIQSQAGSTAIATPGKKLTVISAMDAPILIEPAAGAVAAARSKQACTFRWKAVPTADYYRVRIYGKNSGKPLADENLLSNTFASIDLRNLTPGAYRWEVQAFSYETLQASKRSSVPRSADFEIRSFRPVELISPKDKQVIDGFTALLNPPVLEWQSKEQTASSTIVVTRIDGESRKVLLKLENPVKSYRLDALHAGTYEWTVNAATRDGLDISAESPFRFTVTPVEPFESPANARTDETHFDGDTLRKKHSITFSWSAVEPAKDYILSIKDSENREVFANTVQNTNFTLEDLTMLSKDTFIWSVRAVAFNQQRTEIIRDGKPSQGKFTISFTVTDGVRRKDTGDLYGR